MKLQRILFCAFILSLSIFSQNAFAEIEANITDKYNLEKSVAERIEQALKPRVEKGYFDVSVDIHLSPARHNKDHNAIQSLKITLGLSDKINPAYRETLNDWLKNWVKTSFGSVGEAEVILRKSQEAAQIEKKEPPETFLTTLIKMQNLLGMIFLGSIFIFMRFLGPKSKPSPINPVPMEGVIHPPLAPSAQTEPLTLPATPVKQIATGEEEHVQTLRLKIALLVPNALERTEGLFYKWSQSVTPQHIKIAALMDALTESWRFSTEKSKGGSPSLPSECISALPEALFHFQNLSNEQKLNLYKEIYAELVSENILDLHSEELGFINDLNDEQIDALMLELSEPERVAIFVQMSANLKYRYLSSLPQRDISIFIDQTLNVEEISAKDLRQKIHNWKIKSLTGSQNFQKNHLRLVKVRESISQLSTIDEAQWLYKAFQKHRDSIQDIHPNLNQIGLIPYWPYEKVQKFCMTTKSRDLAVAIEKMPFLKDPLLKACGDVTQSEIIKAGLNLTPEQMEKGLEGFVETFKEFTSKASPEYQKRIS